MTARVPTVNWLSADWYQVNPLVSALAAASGFSAALGTVPVPSDASHTHVVLATPPDVNTAVATSTVFAPLCPPVHETTSGCAVGMVTFPRCPPSAP